jgi:hypothetical protein
LRWTREDERTFTLESLGPPFLTLPFERVYLTRADAMPLGARFDGGAFAVEVAAANAAGPRVLRFVLDEPLDDRRWRFLVWRDGRLTHLSPPALGASLEVPEAEPLIPLVP